MKEKLKEQLLELFKRENWHVEIENFYRSMRVEIIWIMVDFVREGKYLNQALKIAEIYINDNDPTIDSEENQEIIKGNEYRGIVSIRGSTAWLIQAIISKLDTRYYPKAVQLVERLAKDSVHYVRTQATYPLIALMVNVGAVKNPDGTIFDFKDSDKKKAVDLAFYMLDNNRNYPRVMEYLTDVFERMRTLNEVDSLILLNKFIYKKAEEFYPTYVLEKIAPLIIYYAEYRKDFNDGFNDLKHQELFVKVMQTADKRVVSTIVWLIWKTIEEDQKNYPRLKKYISHLFDRNFGEDELLGQYDILIEKIIQYYPKDGVELFQAYLKNIEKILPKIEPEAGGRMWLYSGDMIAEKVAEQDPKSLPYVLNILKEILLKNGYVGDIQKIFFSYKKAPIDLQKELLEKIKPIYAQLNNYPFKPQLEPLE